MGTNGSPAAAPVPSDTDGPAEGGILEWVARACRRFPDRAAVEWRDRRVTYGELNAAANQLAGRLTAGGIGPGSIVAVIAPDRVEVISALLGVFRAGCVFVPLAEDGAPERLREMLNRLSPDALVLGAEGRGWSPGLRNGLSRRGGVVIALPADGPADQALAAPANARAPAYVYYTSGSTGQPKGIVGTLEGLSHFIGWETRTFGIGPGWRVSQFTVPTFDPYFRDVLVPLCTGGTICIPPEPPLGLSPGALMDWVDAQGINLIHCVPTLFAVMLEAELGPRRCRALRHVLLAGEALQTAHVEKWWKVFGDRVGLVNLYGSTETTMVKLFHVIRERDLGRAFIPIGRPIEGAEALLLDEAGRPCPPGTVGEVYVRSRYLTLGYFRDPEATKEVFLPGAGGDTDARLYRTGDLAVELEDGGYRFVGRRDDQVKIRGVRVEPGEVAAVLSRCPQVRSCAVVARKTAGEETVLAAYIVPARRGRISMPELRTFLRRRLPSEMVPSAFVLLDKLPLTDRGKLDRAALPAPAPGRFGLPDEMLAPRTPAEAALAALWCELLGLDEVGVRDHFLHLGGHSVTAVRLATRVRTLFGVEIPIRAVFERPTIEELAEYIEREAARDAPGGQHHP